MNPLAVHTCFKVQGIHKRKESYPHFHLPLKLHSRNVRYRQKQELEASRAILDCQSVRPMTDEVIRHWSHTSNQSR